MTDVLTPEQRRRCMSRVRDRDTEPELKLRKALWAARQRYRLRYKLPGKPDIVFVSRRLVVFVDGCFWHGCPRHATHPKANGKFWRDKLEANIQRDQRVNARLQELGWEVLRFWEHEVNQDVEGVVRRIIQHLQVERNNSPELVSSHV